MNQAKKVLLAMSGGIDSSVSAFLLSRQGFEVMGVYFRLTDSGRGEERARLIASRLGIGFYPLNLSDKFKTEIIDYFISSYERGETPNPCVKCNKAVKFGELIRLADELGFDYVATGHYAKVQRQKTKGESHLHCLAKGRDQKKDQSYFLYRLGQKELARIIFPLGDLTKEEVRRLAEKQGFPEFKSESQDICFLVENGKIIDHNEFLKQKLDLKPGPIIRYRPGALPFQPNKGGEEEVLGRHQGLPLYTIGQRRGVEIGGTGPYYVVRVDYEKNILYVTNDPEDEALYSSEFAVKDINWISGSAPVLPKACEVMIRYRGKAVDCVVAGGSLAGDGEYQVKLKKPERAVASGQSAVFYDQDRVIGGGSIV